MCARVFQTMQGERLFWRVYSGDYCLEKLMKSSENVYNDEKEIFVIEIKQFQLLQKKVWASKVKKFGRNSKNFKQNFFFHKNG